MALLDGGMAAIFGAAFGGVYLPATLHRKQDAVRDAGGSITSGGGTTDVACRAQRDAVTERMRLADGYTDRDVRILVLAASFSGTITTDDEITVAGVRYAIGSVDMDPAGVAYDLRGQRG